MKKAGLLVIPILLILAEGCRTRTDCNELFNLVQENFESGNFREATRLADSIRESCTGPGELIRKSDSLIELSERIRLDFSLNEAGFMSRAESYFGIINDSLLSAWENKKWIEWRMIDGEKMYFNRAASNLALLKMFFEEKEKQDRETAADPGMIERLANTKDIISYAAATHLPVVPVDMKITYTITVQPDAVPEGEIIRCWLPYPRENHARQTGVKLLSVSEEDFVIAPDSTTHRTLYLERKAEKGTETTFSISYRYTSSGIWFDLPGIALRPYDRENSIYKKYTSEQLPNICFTE